MDSTIKKFIPLIEAIKKCKLNKTCRQLNESRQYFFEPNPLTIEEWQVYEKCYLQNIDTSALFVCESPGGFAKGAIPDNFPTDGSKLYRAWASVDHNPGVIDSMLRNNRKFKELRELTNLNNCFITNVCLCGKIPDNRKPKKLTQQEVSNCSIFLQRQIQILKPKIIVALGDRVDKYLSKMEFLKNYKIIKIAHYSYFFGTAWQFWKKPGEGGQLDNLVSQLGKITVGMVPPKSIAQHVVNSPKYHNSQKSFNSTAGSSAIIVEAFFKEINLLDKGIVIEKKSNKSFPLYYSIKKNGRVLIFLEPMINKIGFRTFINSDRDEKLEVLGQSDFIKVLQFIKKRLTIIG